MVQQLPLEFDPLPSEQPTTSPPEPIADIGKRWVESWQKYTWV